MWIRGELAGYLRLSDDGTRVEVIRGEIVVSPGPTLGHNAIVQDIADALVTARVIAAGIAGTCAQTSELNPAAINEGYVSDLVVLDTEILREAQKAEARHLLPAQVELVVEVTSLSTALMDRDPRPERRRPKSTGY